MKSVKKPVNIKHISESLKAPSRKAPSRAVLLVTVENGV